MKAYFEYLPLVALLSPVAVVAGQLERPLPLEQLAKRTPFHIREHNVRQARGFPRIQNGQNMRMLKTGGPADFSEEAGDRTRLGKLGTQNLDRDRDAALRVTGKMHRRRRASTDDALDGVASGKEP